MHDCLWIVKVFTSVIWGRHIFVMMEADFVTIGRLQTTAAAKKFHHHRARIIFDYPYCMVVSC